MAAPLILFHSLSPLFTMAESHLCQGITNSFRAPYSGVLMEADIKASIATLPEAVKDLKEAWLDIGEA